MSYCTTLSYIQTLLGRKRYVKVYITINTWKEENKQKFPRKLGKV